MLRIYADRRAAHRHSGHYRGWIEVYWTPMKEELANGQISEKPAPELRRIERIGLVPRISGEIYRPRLSLVRGFAPRQKVTRFLSQTSAF